MAGVDALRFCVSELIFYNRLWNYRYDFDEAETRPLGLLLRRRGQCGMMIILLVWMVFVTWLSGTRLFQAMVGLVAHMVRNRAVSISPWSHMWSAIPVTSPGL
jgi:hypothetical protein